MWKKRCDVSRRSPIKPFLAELWRRGILGSFLAGLLVLLPVFITFLLVSWLVGQIAAAFGPDTFLGNLFTFGGTLFVGYEQRDLAFWLGVLLALVGIWLLGLVVRVQARRNIDQWLHNLFSRVPILSAIYKPVAQVVKLVANTGDEDLGRMSVVICRLGTSGGVDMLALLASPQVYVINGERRKMVYFPTSPVPMTGGLMLVDAESITPVPEITVENLMKIYLSLGALAPDSMPTIIDRKSNTPEILGVED